MLSRIKSYKQTTNIATAINNYKLAKIYNDSRPVMTIESHNLFNYIYIIIAALAYILLHTHLNIYYEDDSWTISNAYTYIKKGLDHDLIFLDQDGGAITTQFFGKIFFTTIGHILDIIGWTKANVYLLNSIFILTSVYVWSHIMKLLPVSETIQKLVPLMMLIAPSMFFAAHTGRPDAFTFLLLSCGFFSLIRRQHILAGMIGVLAMETHLMGVVTFFYYLGYLLYLLDDQVESVSSKNYIIVLKQEIFPIIVKMIIGSIFGAMIYAGLHWTEFDFSALNNLVVENKDLVSPINNYILSYFFDFDWSYHLPELALLIASIVLFLKHRIYKENRFMTIMLAVLVISTVITRRENRNYFIYVLPILLLYYSVIFETLRKERLLSAIMIVTSVFYFSCIYFNNKDYNFESLSSFISHKTEQSIPLVGMPDIWFVAKDSEYYPIHNQRDFNKITLDKFYLIETDYLSARSRVYTDVKENIYTNYNTEVIDSWISDGDHVANIVLCTKNKADRIFINYKPYPGWQTVVKNYLFASI